MCETNQAPEILFTDINKTSPAAWLERGDTTIMARHMPSGVGKRHEGDFANVLWIMGDLAEVAWPQDKTFTCQVRK